MTHTTWSRLRVALAAAVLVTAGCGGGGSGGAGGSTAALEVTSPDGGETLTASFLATVTWVPGAGGGLVDVDVSSDGGATWQSLVAATPDDGIEEVRVPNAVGTQTRIQVSAADGNPSVLTAPGDVSDADFTIQPPFAETPSGLHPLTQSSLAWGDWDGDGDLDLATAGLGGGPQLMQNRIYRNDGGIFTDIGAPLTGVAPAALAWGDMDQDGDLDLALAGGILGMGNRSRLYRNDGGGVFTELDPGLFGVVDASVAWGDMDQDGDLDLALAGERPSGLGRVTRIYRNDGGGTFTDAVPGLVGFSRCSLAWGDMDGDGDLDLAVAGDDGGGADGRLYRNDGGGTFTDTGLGFFAAESGSLAWGDMDGDGDLDLAVAGTQFAGGVSTVYRNDGGGTFTDVGAGLVGVESCSLAWGDMDADGDLDLALAGSGLTVVYRNDGAGIFTDVEAGLLGVSFCGVAWGDVDGDGDLDLGVIGGEGPLAAAPARIYENRGGTVDARPTAPTGIQVLDAGTRVVWDASSDPETPPFGLSYNLKVGTTAGGEDVRPGHAFPTGRRLLPERGAMQPSGAGGFALLDLPPGSYFVSVQAVDPGFEGSPWSTPVGFVVP